MSIRTTVTLDEDVLQRVKRHAQARGQSFRDTLNELLRAALLTSETSSKTPKFRIKAVRMGYRPELNYDDVESLIEQLEGPLHR
jgi:hypothetical protein